MARVSIENLREEKRISREEMKAVTGGQRKRQRRRKRQLRPWKAGDVPDGTEFSRTSAPISGPFDMR